MAGVFFFRVFDQVTPKEAFEKCRAEIRCRANAPERSTPKPSAGSAATPRFHQVKRAKIPKSGSKARAGITTPSASTSKPFLATMTDATVLALTDSDESSSDDLPAIDFTKSAMKTAKPTGIQPRSTSATSAETLLPDTNLAVENIEEMIYSLKNEHPTQASRSPCICAEKVAQLQGASSCSICSFFDIKNYSVR